MIFGPEASGVACAVHPERKSRLDFTPTPGGWDLTMKVQPPNKANQTLSNHLQNIEAEKEHKKEVKVDDMPEEIRKLIGGDSHPSERRAKWP